MIAHIVKWTVVALYAWGVINNVRYAANPTRDKSANPGLYAFAAVLCALLALGVAVLL